jgi:hypothetical protein
MKRIYALLILTAVTVSCIQTDINEVLLMKEEISLTVKGEEMMTFNEFSCQLGYNSDTNEFRVYDDNLGNMFIITCNARPSAEGQILRADLTWTTSSSTKKRSGLNFTVKKISPDGLIWLWCDSDRIGVIVKELS